MFKFLMNYCISKQICGFLNLSAYDGNHSQSCPKSFFKFPYTKQPRQNAGKYGTFFLMADTIKQEKTYGIFDGSHNERK